MLAYRDVLAGLNGQLLEVRGSPRDAAHLGNVVIDTRTMAAGDLFVALRGERGDGHAYIGDAIAAGAVGVIAERAPDTLPDTASVFLVRDSLAALQALAAYWRAKHDVRVIGVTGSVGKTSTKEIIAHMLGARYTVLRNEGNLNNEIGLPLTMLRLQESHQRVVVEMGMYDVGEIASLCRIARPEVGVVTNIGPSHLARLGTMERIAQAKGELVESLPANGWAILNGDDARVRGLKARTEARTISYGIGSDNDIRAEVVSSRGLSGIAFTLRWGQEAAQVEMSIPGRHSVYGALAAAAVAKAEGFSLSEAAQALRSAESRVRVKTVDGMAGSIIIDDTYNASPASTCAALDLLAELTGRKIAVLGDMLELGSYEEEGHREVGRKAALAADVVVAVGGLGRIAGEEAQLRGGSKVVFAEANEEASEWLLGALRPGDHVLVKGSRGMQMEQIVARIRRQ